MYAREGPNLAILALNRFESAQNLAVDLADKLNMPQNERGDEYEDVLSGKVYHLTKIIHVSLGPETSAVLLPVKEAGKVRASLR